MKKWIAMIALGLLVGAGCAGVDNWLEGKTSQATNERIKTTARSIATLTKVFLPGAATQIDAVCAAIGLNDKEMAVKALQELWVEADEAKVTTVVEEVNDLVGATGLLDSDTKKPEGKWRDKLGVMCTEVQ